MAILVTGGTGYIGSHTTVELLSVGAEVIIVDNLSNSKALVIDRVEKITGKRPTFIKCDLLDKAALDEVLRLTLLYISQALRLLANRCQCLFIIITIILPVRLICLRV